MGISPDLALTINVSNETDLNAALITIAENSLSTAGAYTIDLTNSFTLTTALEAINVAADASLTINGEGYTLSGGGDQPGLFVYA